MLRHQIDFLVQSGGTRVRTQVADDDFYIQTSDGSKYGDSCEPNVKGGNGVNGWEAALPNERVSGDMDRRIGPGTPKGRPTQSVSTDVAACTRSPWSIASLAMATSPAPVVIPSALLALAVQETDIDPGSGQWSRTK